jgi:superfamily II DNA or RNA helicase
LELRKYQEKDLNRINKALSKHDHVLFTGATGYGKTVLLGRYVKDAMDRGEKCLIIVPRIPLIRQFFDALIAFGVKPVQIGIHQGQNTKVYKSAKVHIALTNTLSRRVAQKGIDYLGDIDKVLVDEAHLNFKTDMMKPIEDLYWDTAKWLGVSATPIDNKGYRLEGYDKTIAKIQTIDLVKKGYLLPLDIYVEDAPDLSDVKMSMLGDYQLDSLEDAMNQSALITNVYEVWAKKFKDMKTMILCVDIKHAENVTKEFSDNGISARVYHSKLSKTEDAKTLKEFKEGKIKVLVSVSKLTTGFDEPSVEVLMTLRPTMILSLFIQSVGRVLRPHPSMDKAILVDCAGWIDRFGHPFTRRNFNKKRPTLKAVENEIKSDDQTKMVQCPLCKEEIMTSELDIKVVDKKKQTKITKKCPLCGGIVDEKLIKKRTVKKLKKYKAPKPKKVSADEMKSFLNYLAKEMRYNSGWAYYKMKVYEQKPKEMSMIYHKVYNDEIKNATAVANIVKLEKELS